MDLNRQTMKRILFIVFVSIVMIYGILNFEVVLSLIGKVISILRPFIVGLCLAFLLNLIMGPLERRWMRMFKKPKRIATAERIKRPLCLILSILILMGIIFAVCFIILPQITRTVADIVNMMPGYLKNVERSWNDLRVELEKYSIMLPPLALSQNEVLGTAAGWLASGWEIIFDKTIGMTASIASGVFDFVVAFVFSIYLLAGKERLLLQAKKLFVALLPEKKAVSFFGFIGRVNTTFISFVTGQLTEAVIIGLLCFIGMSVFSIPYAPAVSVLVGVTALIPVFGAFIGTAVGALLILAVSPIKAIWFVVFIIILQQLEGNIIYPHVVGKSVGLPGMWVLFAVSVGGSAFGVLGMLFSVPVCSIIYVSLSEFVQRRLKQKNCKL